MRKISAAIIAYTFLLTSCATLLQPSTSYDRRRAASAYGAILTQANPNCQNCTDRFLVKKPDGQLCTVVVRFDGRVEVLE